MTNGTLIDLVDYFNLSNYSIILYEPQGKNEIMRSLKINLRKLLHTRQTKVLHNIEIENCC